MKIFSTIREHWNTMWVDKHEIIKIYVPILQNLEKGVAIYIEKNIHFGHNALM